MARTIGDLLFGFRGDGKQLVVDAKKAGGDAGTAGAQSFDKTFSGRIKSLKAEFSRGGGIPGALMGGVGLGVGLGVFAAITTGIGTVIGALGNAVSAAIEEEASIAALTKSIEENSAGWDGNMEAVEEVIEARQRLAFADDAQRDSLRTLVAVTKDVNEALRLQRLAMDFARLRGISLADAGTLIGKVYGGNVAILRRYGIQIRAGATATEALAEIQQMSAGQAEAYAETTAGGMDALNIAIDNTMENIGKGLLPLMKSLTDAAMSLVDALNAVGDSYGAWGEVGEEAQQRLNKSILEGLAAEEKWIEMQETLASAMGLTHEALDAELTTRLNLDRTMTEQQATAQVYAEFLRDGFVPASKAAADALGDMGDAGEDVARKVPRAFEKVSSSVEENLKPLTGIVKGILVQTGKTVNERMKDIRWSLEHPTREKGLKRKYRDAIKDGTDAMNKALKEGNAAAYAKAKKFVADMKAKLEELTKADWTFRVVQMQTVASRHGGEHIPGHASGMPYVPYDNYIARLHEGERVLTKAENMQGSMSGTMRHEHHITLEGARNLRTAGFDDGRVASLMLASPDQAIRRWEDG